MYASNLKNVCATCGTKRFCEHFFAQQHLQVRSAEGETGQENSFCLHRQKGAQFFYFIADNANEKEGWVGAVGRQMVLEKFRKNIFWFRTDFCRCVIVLGASLSRLSCFANGVTSLHWWRILFLVVLLNTPMKTKEKCTLYIQVRRTVMIDENLDEDIWQNLSDSWVIHS